MWEDPVNITGGKWILRLKKGVADRVWESLVLAIVGDQFSEPAEDESEVGAEVWPQVCGCTISVRQNEDIINLWIRGDDVSIREVIRYAVLRGLQT